MNNRFYDFLRSIEDISFREPTENELEKLKDLSGSRLPEMFMEVYSKTMPADDAEFSDFVFYGIDRIIEENTDYVPGADLLPYGLFTFASTFDGDSICFDMNDPVFPVYQCSHSLLDAENGISFYKKEMITLDFNMENILKVSPRLADSFEDFVELLIKDEVETFSVTEMLEDL